MPRSAPLLVLALLVSTALAACVDEADPAPPADPGTGGAGGATDAAAVAGESTEEGVALEPAVPVDLPLVYDGETHFAFCVVVVVQGTCQFIDPSDTAFRPIEEVEGEAQRLVAEITWQPVSPLSAQLTASLSVQEADGNWYSNASTPVTDGGSPLSIDWDLTPFAGKPLMLAIMGFQQAGGPPVGGAGGELKQPFHVEGTLTCLQPQE